MRAALITLLLALLPTAASAHLVESGFGDFYDGALHLFVTPGDLLILIGLALLAGLQGPTTARAVLVSLLAGWLGGVLISLALSGTFALDRGVVVAFGVLGLLVLLDRRIPRRVMIALGLGVGIVQGLGAALSMREQTVSWLWVAGSMTSLAIVATLLAALVVAARAPWMKIAVRALGSWLAAVSVLMLGWALRSM